MSLWRMDEPERFIEQIRWTCNEDKNGCWIWPNPNCSNEKRPLLRIDTKQMTAARWVLYAKTGELGEQARHTCDVGPCCNPDHLIWGTQEDNIRDRVSRNRSAKNKNPHHGEANGSSKLTELDVIDIRKRHNGEGTAALATEFQVSKGLICKIVRRDLWKNVIEGDE